MQLWRGGDDGAIEQVAEAVYQDLKRLAAFYLVTERTGHTLQPTALVHEAFLHISSLRNVDWKTRAHFVAVMAQMMRRILVDHARKRSAAKRAGHLADTPQSTKPGLDILAVDLALERLAKEYPRHAKVVELRFFGGLNTGDVAEVLQVSLATVERDWRFAKAWLQSEMSGSGNVLE